MEKHRCIDSMESGKKVFTCSKKPKPKQIFFCQQKMRIGK